MTTVMRSSKYGIRLTADLVDDVAGVDALLPGRRTGIDPVDDAGERSLAVRHVDEDEQAKPRITFMMTPAEMMAMRCQTGLVLERARVVLVARRSSAPSPTILT